MIIAQLSDLHVDGGERSRRRVERVVRELAGLRPAPDVVLVTGDIADHGAEAEYELARELVDLPAPVLYCPGNHDGRAAYRKVLLGEPASDAPVNRAHRVGGALFAMCDSSIPGQHDGLLEASTLGWLDAELTAAADLPAFVCFHHPPVVLGSPFADQSRQFATDRLASLVAAHPNVVALLCGHAHTPAATTFAGRPLLVAPGVVSTFRLPFEPADTIDQDLPPMLAYHLLDNQRRLTTHYRVVSA
ncbi:3',5'-cyclic adenosine monophosphate phosphodiesterase CpdA [Asanoa ishikariensis]|uniref:3',5'-cyclic AMP phosphodiesterase CpdA n=1 Tax=Asanoa ishikariensis TaxID=137265 RepID=A0A1H3UPC7_9ACTN|nr:metallophosphoesterase [Asanoa ishikariensis]GIF69132.1 3',5'-cyclic adenosine monophosphate phosphodiesterase CpdA [Asanoa ishikariensis]SDZ64248.1 3',5'-cyclic AMP phosphodiesterase CpdA [Asanoa ishikariensis]